MQPFEMTSPEETQAAETELRAQMQRVAAPAGFTDRLMARVEAEQPKKAKVLMFRSPMTRTWLGGAIAAMLALGVFAGERKYEEHRRAEVQQQFETAMRVTDHALSQTRDQLAKAGISLGE